MPNNVSFRGGNQTAEEFSEQVIQEFAESDATRQEKKSKAQSRREFLTKHKEELKRRKHAKQRQQEVQEQIISQIEELRALKTEERKEKELKKALRTKRYFEQKTQSKKTLSTPRTKTPIQIHLKEFGEEKHFSQQQRPAIRAKVSVPGKYKNNENLTNSGILEGLNL